MMLLSFSKNTLHKVISRNTFLRSKSAWLNQKKLVFFMLIILFSRTLKNEKEIDVEALYVSNDVQVLLKNLTGLDISNKIFTEKKVHSLERSHFALMTDEAYQKVIILCLILNKFLDS